MEDQQFSLKWNNFSSSLLTAFSDLKDEDAFVDVTLACDGQLIKAHKVILSACSVYFKRLFQSNPCQHPIIFLRDVNHYEMQSILTFIYNGEVNVSQRELPSLLKTAEALKIKGLAEETPIKQNCKKGLDIEFGNTTYENTSLQPVLNPNLEIIRDNGEYCSPLKKLKKLSSRFDDLNDDRNIDFEDRSHLSLEQEPYNLEIKVEDDRSDHLETCTNEPMAQLAAPQPCANPAEQNDTCSLRDNHLNKVPQCQGLGGHYCTICNKLFPSKAKLTHHVEAKHLPNKAGYVCNICGKTAPTKNAVYIHRSRYHSSWKCFSKSSLDSSSA